jgi:hypothetical protein
MTCSYFYKMKCFGTELWTLVLQMLCFPIALDTVYTAFTGNYVVFFVREMFRALVVRSFAVSALIHTYVQTTRSLSL